MPQYKTPDLLKKKRLRKYWLVFLTLAFISTLIFSLSFWSKHYFFQITKINVSGNKYLATDFIDKSFQEATTDNLIYLFNKNNFLFLPRGEIIRQIENELPVSAVYIKMPNLHEVDIEVVEYEPVAYWCANEDTTECFLVNSDGLLFVKNTEPISSDLVALSGKIEVDPLGAYYIDTKVFNNFITIQKLLKRINVGISRISTEDFETFLFQTKSGPYLKIARKSDPAEVVNNLKTTLEQESIHEIQFSNIEYIDLRFSGRAYYKIK